MLKLDLHDAPFSRFGSWLSIAYPTWVPGEADHLWLRSHHGGGLLRRELFRIDVMKGGRRVAFTVDATPARVVLRAGGGEVALCIAPVGTVRLKGRGLSVRFEAATGTYVVAHPSPGGRWTVNSRPNCHRYEFEALRGRLCGDAPWGGLQCRRIVMTFVPDASGVVEGAVDEFESTWRPRPRPPFAACVREVESEWREWLRDELAGPIPLRRAAEHASYVNWSAAVRPDGYVRRTSLLMSKFFMDRVWSWDHCFNAMALAYRRPALAWDQLMTLFDSQDEFGALPDEITDRYYNYCFSKPPVHGWALSFMRRANRALSSRERLAEIYPVLARWTEWWLTDRVWPGETLPHYLHGNDSGWDNSTVFDSGAPLIGPDLAAFLVLDTEELASVASALGRKREAAAWTRRSAGLLDALLARLWRGDRFVAARPDSGLEMDTESLFLCLPVVLGRRLPEAVQRALVKRIRGFETAAGLATERPSSVRYEPDGYWRGPMWAPSTMLVVDGLRQLGEEAPARRIAGRFCRTCAKQGFAENFDALTGRPLRDRAYTWTASVFLILAHEFLGRRPPR